MKYILRVIAVLMLLAALAACGGPAAVESGEDSPQAGSGDAAIEGPVITNESADQTIKLKIGDQVVVKLDTEHDWGVDSTPAMIFGKVDDAQLPEGAQAVFEAKMAGKATFQATGKPVCAKNDPPCEDPNEQFSVKIEVTRE